MREPISDEGLEWLKRGFGSTEDRKQPTWSDVHSLIDRLEAAEAKLTEYRKYADRLENEEHQRIQAEEKVAELKAELEAAEKQAEAARWARGTWREQAEVAKQRIAELQAENQCDVCGGTGKPASNKPCMCGGSGKASDAVTYLRSQLVEAEGEVQDLRGHEQAVINAASQVEELEADKEGLTKDGLILARHVRTLEPLVRRAAQDSCVTTADDPGCFYCDHTEHTPDCPAAKALRDLEE